MEFLKSIFKGLFAEEISSLQRQIQLKQEALNEKTATIHQLKHEKERLSSELDSCHQEINNLRILENTLKETISSKNSEISAKTYSLDSLNNILSGKQVEIENYKHRNNEYCQQINGLESENNSLKRLLKKLIDYKNRQIKDNDVKSKQTERKLGIVCGQIDGLNSQKASLEIKINELLKELDTLRSTSSKKEQENIELSNLLHEKEESLKEIILTVDALKDEVKKYENLLSEANSQLSAITARKDALETEQQALLDKLAELQNKSRDEELLNALKNDLKQKQETISALESDIQHLNEELSTTLKDKNTADVLLDEKNQECENLKNELRSISAKLDGIGNKEKLLKQAENRIAELENSLKNAPSISELIKRDKEIERLKSKIREYEIKITELEAQKQSLHVQGSPKIDVQTPKKTEDPSVPSVKSVVSPKKTRLSYRKPIFPYRKKPIAPSKDVVTVDFPIIENDNVYSQTARLIDKVFNHRSNTFITANDIFLRKSVEEISRMRVELEEAARTGVPYLTCPCCGNMVKISSRRIGFGQKSKEVQYFTHAVKNIPCDLKRDNSYSLTIDEGESGENDFSYLNELRNLLANSLRTEFSHNKGITEVKESVYISSEELPIMKRRLADVTAHYKDTDIVFELVTPNTNIARVHDRDIFYLINRKQVFWIFGLESIVDYNELSRSVSKDIFFTNKRNVFVFDLDAQEESKRRGELMLKCNWLDQDGAWYYQIEKNGKNGILISLDQINFEQDSCRPYFFDADEAFYLKHPAAERPLQLSREKLKEDIIEAWNYDQERRRACDQMQKEGCGVEAYYDSQKWGFKFGDTIFIEPAFDSKPIMLGDFAKVEKNGKFGVVNRFGDYRLQPEYDMVELLPNGYILYASKDNWYLFGIIDPLTTFASSDNVVVSTISRRSSIYHLIIKKHLFTGQQPEEFYFVGNEIFKKNINSGKWSLWQSNGEKVTDISWDTLEFTSEDTIKVSINGRTQLLSLDGTVLDEQRYKSEIQLTNCNLIIESFDGLWGITDVNNNEIVSPIYDAIIVLGDKYLKFQKGIRWGIMTSTGEIISKPVFQNVIRFDGENFEVTKPNETKGWGYLSGRVDKTGMPVSESISQMEDGSLITKSFEKYGLEKDNVILIPHIYESLIYWGEDKYIAQRDNKFGIIDARNKILLAFENSAITPLKEGRSSIKKGASQFEIDSSLRIIEDTVINLKEGYKKVKFGGKWGILNPNGEIIVDYLYDELSTFRGRLVGIINERLIKLDAYYPYRLPMNAKNLGIVDSRDLIISGGVKFQNLTKRNKPQKDLEIPVVLINWTSSMKYPIVLPYDKTKHNSKAKHIDKASDFSIGDTFDVQVKSIITGYGTAKGKRKGVAIALPNGMKSYVYKKDFVSSGIDISYITIGDNLTVTKLGYDEELDRTLWKVKRDNS